MKKTESNEWIKISENPSRVGLLDKAVEQLGEIVFITLPEVGKEVKKGDEIAVIESTKAAVDMYAPVSGKVIAVNSALEADPTLVNKDPLGEGWFFEIEMSDPNEKEELESL